MEFHNHSSTGNGGVTRWPSGPITSSPSANFQCSRLISVGIKLPVAKLPGRSEIDTTAKSGNRVKASSTHSAACVPSTRQRCWVPVTMAMRSSLGFALVA